MRWFRKFFGTKKAHKWAETSEAEFGVGNFRYVSGTYAKKGEVVTCECGHHIFTFQRDVKVGEEWDSTAMSFWRQPPPEYGTIYEPCTRCGARWYKGAYLHFFDGWRIGRGGEYRG